MSIEEIVAGLKEQGLDDAGIEASLKEMLEKGEISQEDYDKAIAMLGNSVSQEEEEKKLAEQLYGMEL